MKKVKLPLSKIAEIVSESDTISDCLTRLYLEVIPDKFEDIIKFNSFPQVNEKTAITIMQEMHKKWDRASVNMLWMNKGFSSSHEDLKDFQVRLPGNLYTLYTELDDITAGFAKIEVEEFGQDPNEYEYVNRT
jgi:hypothetical protein